MFDPLGSGLYPEPIKLSLDGTNAVSGKRLEAKLALLLRWPVKTVELAPQIEAATKRAKDWKAGVGYVDRSRQVTQSGFAGNEHLRSTISRRAAYPRFLRLPHSAQ